MKELISVIIPVYNVEKYIHRCINSVINQTYTNLEIILVDDESPDNCPKICDEYATKDKRIIVIHKKNSGLSDSRNKGIEVANGKYITFIDSDDWIHTDSIRLLYDSLIENNADISSGLLQKVYNENIVKKSLNTEKNIVYSNEEALEKLMYLQSFSNSAPGKLYKIELFKTIKYPIKKHYEDLATTYKLFAISNKIVLLNRIVYFYFQNKNSIMHKKYSKKRLEGIYFAKEELKFIKKHFPNIIPSAIYRLFFECLCCINDMNFLCKDKKQIYNLIKKYRKSVLNDIKVSKKQLLLCYSSFFGQPGIKLAFFFKEKTLKIRK